MGRRSATPHLESRVRAARLLKGLSQQELAQRVGLTRQVISAVESGHYILNTAVALRLAPVLGSRVEELFVLVDVVAPQAIHLPAPLVPDVRRLAVVNIRGRLAGYPLAAGRELQEGFVSADGLLTHGGASTQTELLTTPEALERTALLLGCDPSLGILSAPLARRVSGLRPLWLSACSQAALDALARGEICVAGSHLREPQSGEYNLAYARRSLVGTGGMVVAFARWEQGLVVAPGNPKGFRTVADLARPEVRIVNRDLGSGSRALLDELLAQAGVPAEAVPGYDRIVGSHMAVARAVASGGADTGIALRATARALGLNCVPLTEAHGDFVVPCDQLDYPAVALLLELRQSDALRAELAALPGYDVSRMRTIIADVPAVT